MYIFDTVGLFGGQMAEFHKMWKEVIGPGLGKHRDDVIKLSAAVFSEVTEDVRNAARIPQDRQLTAEEIQSTCQFAFEKVFEG